MSNYKSFKDSVNKEIAQENREKLSKLFKTVEDAVNIEKEKLLEESYIKTEPLKKFDTINTLMRALIVIFGFALLFSFIITKDPTVIIGEYSLEGITNFLLLGGILIFLFSLVLLWELQTSISKYKLEN